MIRSLKDAGSVVRRHLVATLIMAEQRGKLMKEPQEEESWRRSYRMKHVTPNIAVV